MTKQSRNKLLQQAYDLLDRAYDLLLEANEAEQESYDAWPESLQDTERYQIAEGRATMVDDASSAVEELRDNIEAIINDEVL